jgi:hypothetical protein
MSEDFVSRLQLQLRDAAEREERAGALAHPLRRVRWQLTSPAVAAGVAALLAVLGVAAGTVLLRGEPEPAGLRVIAKLELTGNPDQILPAFGSVWISDPVAGEIVRVDPESRRVLARIPVGSAQYVAITPVGKELWAQRTDEPVLQRIDPATNAVSGRVRLRTPGGRPFRAFGVLASPEGVWADGNEGALRLDPSSGAGLALVGAPDDDAEGVSLALGDEDLWSLRSDNRIERFAAATGEPAGDFVSGLPGTQAIDGFGRDVMAGAGSTLARLDGRSGRVLWRRTLGERINASGASAGLIWLCTSEGRGEPNRLTAIAADSGKTVTSTALDTFGATGLAVVGNEIWIDTAGGTTIVLRR